MTVKKRDLRRSIIAVAAIAVLASPAMAGTGDDAGLWTALEVSGPVRDRLLFTATARARIGEDEDGLYESELSTFLGYRITDKVSVWAGYARFGLYERNEPTEVEDRLRQQITADLGKALGGSLSSRVRLEQRFRKDAGTGWRLRPQLAFSRPFTKDGPALVLSHESFIELNDTSLGQNAGYRRMRNFAGISVPLSKVFKAQFGYLNQADFDRGGDSIKHILDTTLSLAF